MKRTTITGISIEDVCPEGREALDHLLMQDHNISIGDETTIIRAEELIREFKRGDDVDGLFQKLIDVLYTLDPNELVFF